MRDWLAMTVVVSTHLDDAALSCGAFIATSTRVRVVTALAGDPPVEHPLTEWDSASGFRATPEAMVARRLEDRAACRALGAEPVWLEFLDRQYRLDDQLAVGDIVDRLDALIGDGETAFGPLGLFHPDHIRIGEVVAALVARSASRGVCWYAYADVPYRRIGKGRVVTSRLEELRVLGLAAIPTVMPCTAAAATAKVAAIACYTSQLRALAQSGVLDMSDTTRPEQFWRLIAASPASV